MSSRRSSAARLTPGPSASLTAPGGRPKGWVLMRGWSLLGPPYRHAPPGTAPPAAMRAASAPDSGATKRASRTRTPPRVVQLAFAEAAHQHPHRLHAGALGGFAVPRRVAHHHGLPAPGLLDGGGHEVGLGLGRLDVCRGGPAVDDRARVEQLE